MGSRQSLGLRGICRKESWKGENMIETLYCEIEKNDTTDKLIRQVGEYAEETAQQVYIIKQPLGDKKKYDYKYDNAAVLLIPKHKIIILNYGQKCEEFDDFGDDFEEDLGHLSDRYEYKKILGRPREWKKLIERVEDFQKLDDIKSKLENYQIGVEEERKVDLLISLLIGSINDIEKVGIEYPETILDKVKHKIVLFDGMQSRFIYEPIEEAVIKIQGLAGTGKTELLLHKLRRNYVEDKESRIVFTCYNKVLAEDMKARIPQFFNFMKVDEQIEWWSRLWVFPSWGSQNAPLTGMYSYICKEYGLNFKRYSRTNSFEQVCLDAISQLEQKEEYRPCFDYVYIDESQDFPQAFFDLCGMVTKEQIFIAGDIFQNVFDVNIKPAVDCHYLLNKCYRTDPHTLMVAHSIGMGLYERPVVRWLEDDEWNACGYRVDRREGKIALKRERIRRFEDVVSTELQSVQIRSCDTYIEEIFNCIDEIKKNNSTVKAGDIAVVFLSNSKTNYTIADNLVYCLDKKYGWDSCQGYVTKSKMKDRVFISNVNNVKGLEFPFVICVCTEKITDSIKQRNSIYMILTRSFLNSYLIINSANSEFIECYSKAITSIQNQDFIVVSEPSEEEKAKQAEKIKIATNNRRGKSLEDIIDEVCKYHEDLSQKDINRLYSVIPNIIEEETEEEISSKTRGMIGVLLGDS